MKASQSGILALVLAICLIMVALAATPSPALSAPAEETNLLKNPDFEGTYVVWEGNPDRTVPESWGAWWDPNGQAEPRFNESGERVQSGGKSGSYWDKWATYQAGFYQSDIPVTPGTIYRFQIYGYSWSTQNDQDRKTSTSNVGLKVGIDPNGGKNWAGGVVWSGEVISSDKWTLISVQVEAKASTITVFTYGRPDWAVAQSDVYWDNASLVAVGQGAAPTATPKPGSTSTSASNQPKVPVGSIPKSTPNADGSVVHVVAAGETLIGIAVTYNISLEELRRLNDLKSDTIYVGQRLIIVPAGGAAAPPPQPQPTEVPSAGGGGDSGGTGDSGGDGGSQPADSGSGTTPLPAPTGNGTVCILSFQDTNANGAREPGENPAAGITFLIADSADTPVDTYTSDGVTSTHCFSDLVPGNYKVSWTGDLFSPTNANTWVVDIKAGETQSHEFGVSGGGAPVESGAGDDTGDAGEKKGFGGIPGWILALVAALGVILLLSGVGAAGYFLILRQPADID